MIQPNRLSIAAILMGSVGIISGCRLGNSLPKDLQGLQAPLPNRGPGEIVIYYANETPSQSKDIGKEYQRIQQAIGDAKSGLKSVEQSALDRIATSYSKDLSTFAAQVQTDIEGLERQICGDGYAGKRKAALFVFTNALAKESRAKVCGPGDQGGRLNEIPFVPVLNAQQKQDFRYAESPLALEGSFVEALRTAREWAGLYGLGDFDGVLIVKSHGGGEFAVAPKLSYRSDRLTDDQLVARYKGVASSVAWGTARLVDLKLESGQRLGDVPFGAQKLEDASVSGSDARLANLKLGDLKLSDLNLGADGALKIGELKIGDLKIGDLKIGELKVGDLKLGDLKIGDLKIGDLKIGDLKLNDLKIGELKVGDLKVGDLKNDLAAEQSTLGSPGITKNNLVEIVIQSGFNYQLVFLESCDSDLGNDLTIDLIFGVWSWDGRGKVGSLYYSDNKGLQFETVNYGALPRAGEYFSDGLSAALEAKRVR